MYPALANLFKRLFPPSQSPRILVLGLDAAGKTTILYRLALGEVITAIPTIGFNVELLELPTANGVLKVTAWDLGGCDKIRPLLRHYYPATDGVIFVVDSHDRDRVSEAMEELAELKKNLEIELGSVETPYLILANKQDLANSMTVEEVSKAVIQLLPENTLGVGVFGISATAERAAFMAGMQPALDWLAHQIANKGKAVGPVKTQAEGKAEDAPPAISSSDPRSPEALAAKLESWVARAETDTTPDELLDQFHSLTLPSWDQYTHVRVAYVILTKFGRAKGKNMIFDGIKHYIENSTRTNGRSFHITMTYFWIQMIHFGIAGFQVPGSIVQGALTPDQFGAFLLMNPHVANTNLWEDYYSRSVIMTPQAQGEMVLPDKKRLPDIVQRDAPKLRIAKGQ